MGLAPILVDQILASGAGVLAGEYEMVYFSGDDLLAALRPRGLPVGNPPKSIHQSERISAV